MLRLEQLTARATVRRFSHEPCPSFDRVFRTLPPTIMRALERKWSLDIRKLSAGSVIAVDGKALKHASTDGIHTPYIVSAWATDAGFVLGEVKTAEKSNEITAVRRARLFYDETQHPKACAVRGSSKGRSLSLTNCSASSALVHRCPTFTY